MKVSEVFSSDYELLVRIYSQQDKHSQKGEPSLQARSALKQIESAKAKGTDFFALFSRSTYGIRFKMLELKNFSHDYACTIGTIVKLTMQNGLAVWFHNQSRTNTPKYAWEVIDRKVFATLHEIIMKPYAYMRATKGAFKGISEREYSRIVEERRNARFFDDGMPSQRYKKPGKRGFRMNFAQEKVEIEQSDTEKILRRELNALFRPYNMRIGLIADFRTLDRIENRVMRPRKVAYTE